MAFELTENEYDKKLKGQENALIKAVKKYIFIYIFFTTNVDKIDLYKHLRIQISERSFTQRFDVAMTKKLISGNSRGLFVSVCLVFV